MNKIRTIGFLLCFCLPVANLLAQHTDSILMNTSLSGDTLYLVKKNIPDHTFWGNSWNIGLNYQLSNVHEFTLNVGRTYGKTFVSGGGFNVNSQSWGLGYSHYKKRAINGQTLSGFWEKSNFFLPPTTVRVAYIYDLHTSSHYVRPALGLNLYKLDILYAYSFKISGQEPPYHHGLIIRFKHFINSDNWQEDSVSY